MTGSFCPRDIKHSVVDLYFIVNRMKIIVNKYNNFRHPFEILNNPLHILLLKVEEEEKILPISQTDYTQIRISQIKNVMYPIMYHAKYVEHFRLAHVSQVRLIPDPINLNTQEV